MLGFLLAAVLAGPPAPPNHQAQHAEIARVADGAAADLTWLALGASADLYTTAWALHEGATESNPLGFDAEARLALKLGTTVASAGACYALRRHGHHRAATVIRWFAFGAQAAAAANNARNALKGHP